MTEEMKKELEHDLIIMKAKFLLTQDFATIKKDVEIFAEIGMDLPMLIYCASETIQKNEIIDKIIATYPEMSSEEILIAKLLGMKTKEYLTKAQIRLSRKRKFCGAENTDSENMLQVLKNSSAIIDGASVDRIIESFNEIVRTPDEFSDSSVIIGFSNLLRRNISPPFVAYEALMGVANQPYSKYYDMQIEARKIYFNSDEDIEEQ